MGNRAKPCGGSDLLQRKVGQKQPGGFLKPHRPQHTKRRRACLLSKQVGETGNRQAHREGQGTLREAIPAIGEFHQFNGLQHPFVADSPIGRL